MAKVTGPLMSMSASGKFGKALVFANRIGTNVVRGLVTPANPRNAGQTDARNLQRVAGAAQKWANHTTEKGESRTVTDKAAIQAITPSGQRWNSFLVKNMIGAGAVNATAAAAIYDAFTTEKAAWIAAADALTPAFPAVNQVAPITGAPITPMTSGKAFFMYEYGLYVMGIKAIPGAVPPTYA